MNKLSKVFSFISVCCGILIFSFAIYYLWTTAQKSMLRSCVSSFAGDIVEYSHEIDNFTRNGENWYVLTEDETKHILSDEHITFNGCSAFISQPQDLKEKRPKIAVRKNNEYGYRIMVWSRGFDNISGTDDDVSSSWEEEIPE